MKLKSPTPPFKTHSWFFGINSYGYHYAKCSKCGIIGKKKVLMELFINIIIINKILSQKLVMNI